MPDEPVVVHFKDGRTLQGYTEDFLERDTEILVRDASTDEQVTVHLAHVKVVCFVRNLFTSGVVRNRETPPILHESRGRRAEVVFRDGEKLGGTVRFDAPPTGGFFIIPLNRNANSIRIYVNPAELVGFRFVT